MQCPCGAETIKKAHGDRYVGDSAQSPGGRRSQEISYKKPYNPSGPIMQPNWTHKKACLCHGVNVTLNI